MILEVQSKKAHPRHELFRISDEEEKEKISLKVSNRARKGVKL